MNCMGWMHRGLNKINLPGGYQHVTFLQTKTSTFWENVDIHRENGGTILHQNFYHEAFHVMFLARSPKPLRFVAADVVCLLWPVWKVRMGIGMGSPSGKWDVPFLRMISWQDVSSKFFCLKAGIYYWTEIRVERKYNEGKTLWIRYFVLMPIAVPFGSCARHWNNINIFGLPIPLNRPTDQAPWGFSMNFHEFPQPKPIILSDPTFLEGWIFFFSVLNTIFHAAPVRPSFKGAFRSGCQRVKEGKEWTHTQAKISQGILGCLSSALFRLV